MENKYISLFGGTGFIGSTFYSRYSDQTNLIDRNGILPVSGNKVLYMISTSHNYNVLTDPYIDIETNLLHLMKILNNCKDRNIEFIYISSWFVYGDTDLPAREDSPCKPRGFYSITKYAAEQLVASYCKTFKIDYKIIRLSNVIGKNDGKVSKKKNALQYLISEMKENRDIKLYNNGEFYRDFTHVDDVVDGIKFIIDKGISGEIYNLGSARQPTLFKDIIAYAYKEIKSTSKIESMEASDFHKIVQVESMYLDSSKLGSLGFFPSKGVYESIKELL
jgi:nucleoside-diphosphate-sugar epimerase